VLTFLKAAYGFGSPERHHLAPALRRQKPAREQPSCPRESSHVQPISREVRIVVFVLIGMVVLGVFVLQGAVSVFIWRASLDNLKRMPRRQRWWMLGVMLALMIQGLVIFHIWSSTR
jgi:hypothetical protein